MLRSHGTHPPHSKSRFAPYGKWTAHHRLETSTSSNARRGHEHVRRRARIKWGHVCAAANFRMTQKKNEIAEKYSEPAPDHLNCVLAIVHDHQLFHRQPVALRWSTDLFDHLVSKNDPTMTHPMPQLTKPHQQPPTHLPHRRHKRFRNEKNMYIRMFSTFIDTSIAPSN